MLGAGGWFDDCNGWLLVVTRISWVLVGSCEWFGECSAWKRLVVEDFE